MTTIINMPTAASGNKLRGKVEDNRIIILVDIPNEYAADGKQSWRVCELSGNLGSIAYDLALLLERARNIGYAHAQADMREMLGVKPC